jgi:hypothetical protein
MRLIVRLFGRKLLAFEAKQFFLGDSLYHVQRLPRSNNVLIFKCNIIKVVSIADFIMMQPSNKARLDCAYFVFQTLEWHENICIKSAIKKGLIKEFQDCFDFRIVNGEVWAMTDYQLDLEIRGSMFTDHPYNSYPELPFDVLALPPYLPLNEMPVTSMEHSSYGDSLEKVVSQLNS